MARARQVGGSPEQAEAVYRSEMRRLLEAVEHIPTELLASPIYGRWTVKEVLVHIAGWDRAVVASADDVLAGRPARLTKMRLGDINRDLVEAKRAVSLEQARRELAEAHQDLLDKLAGLSMEQWQRVVPGARWAYGRPMTVASVFAYRYRGQTHYGGHAEEIETWLQRYKPS